MRDSFITLNSGRSFDFMNIKSNEICIEDIAHGLSNLCRFSGQTPKFYSVAEHCVLASNKVPYKFKFDVLMHDAAEAFVGDMVTPLKARLPGYRAIENEIQFLISNQFGVSFPLPKEVKQADLRILASERETPFEKRARMALSERCRTI